jgi:hypothetical protein
MAPDSKEFGAFFYGRRSGKAASGGKAMFEYLGVLIAVILGLSLTHLLRGLSKLIHMRRTVKPYWVQIVWTVNILIYVLAVWWGMFWWNKLQAWSIEEFFAIAALCLCNTPCISRRSSSSAWSACFPKIGAFTQRSASLGCSLRSAMSP